MKIIKSASYKKAQKADNPFTHLPNGPYEWSPDRKNIGESELGQRGRRGERYQWQTAKVFTQAPGFGEGQEIEENRTITIRPEENEEMALKREGFNPLQSRIEIINR